MGGTANPQNDKNCPNCGVEANEGIGTPDADNVGLLECHNSNCAVDRFWGVDIYE